MKKTRAEYINRLVLEAGAVASGCVAVDEVDAGALRIYDTAVARDRHGSMSWMERNRDIRRDPALLLDGARTLVCAAFSFAPAKRHPHISDYALPREDYHTAIRKRLSLVGEELVKCFGGAYRACVDSAPLRERYWAVKSGIASQCLNNCVAVPGAGTEVFLAELILTLATENYGASFLCPSPGMPQCSRCGLCVENCPTGALKPDGSCDMSRCLSYLTVEYRGDSLPSFASGIKKAIGCDICREVCPLNSTDSIMYHAPQWLAPEPGIYDITPDDMADMSSSDFRLRFRLSAISRLKPAMLRRNARFLLGDTDN